MRRIGLLSDTHCFVDDRIFKYFESCDEIWHAGDLGCMEVADKLSKFRPFTAVHGNIDGTDIKKKFSTVALIECEKVKVLMIHIGGYPRRYDKYAKTLIEKYRPQLFISGHSHILKVMFDKDYNMLHINPGAVGNYGLHLVKTMVRFTIDADRIKDLEVIELERGSAEK